MSLSDLASLSKVMELPSNMDNPYIDNLDYFSNFTTILTKVSVPFFHIGNRYKYLLRLRPGEPEAFSNNLRIGINKQLLHSKKFVHCLQILNYNS